MKRLGTNVLEPGICLGEYAIADGTAARRLCVSESAVMPEISAYGLGFGGWVLGFGFWGLGFGVWGLGLPSFP